MNQQLFEKYAEFAVRVGAGVLPGQTLMITTPIEAAEFARCCAKAAFAAGARDVSVRYSDEKLARIRYEQASEEALCDAKPWVERSYLDYVEGKGGASILHILGEDPEAFLGLDAGKINRAMQAARNAQKRWREMTMKDEIAWSIVAVPTENWAKKIFPDLPADQAVEELWQAIFDVCRVTGGDPVAAWRQHVAATAKRRDKLNAMGLTELHFTSANGTDLRVGLAEGAIFEGAASRTPSGQQFIANVPTEEVFTAPHRRRVNGIVYGTKPYVFNGDLIEGFWVRFEEGRVVESGAEKNADLLRTLLDTDEGSRSIGEVALVPASSPINRSGILFYNTLFDENAACHIAFGDGYPGTVAGGNAMTREQLLACGVNHSVIHEDVMIGAEDTRIVGKTADGCEVEIFRDGVWAL